MPGSPKGTVQIFKAALICSRKPSVRSGLLGFESPGFLSSCKESKILERVLKMQYLGDWGHWLIFFSKKKPNNFLGSHHLLLFCPLIQENGQLMRAFSIAVWIGTFWVLDWTGINHSESCSCTKMHSALGKKWELMGLVSFGHCREELLRSEGFGATQEVSDLHCACNCLRLLIQLQFVCEAWFIFLLVIYLLLLIPHNICVLFPDPPAWFYSLKLLEFCFCSNVFAF